MAISGCGEAMQLLNLLFMTPLILNDGHEIHARLQAGDDLADVIDDYAQKFGKGDQAGDIRAVTESWPKLHLEAVRQIVQWALGKLDTDERVTINWKGDADNPETVTRFELRDQTLLIEFAHPPGSIRLPA